MPCCSCLGPTPTSQDVFRLSIASLIFTFLAAYLGVRLYLLSGSSLCLVLGVENMVDFLSSLVVLWRFYAPALSHREERASVAISAIMVLLGVFIMTTSIADTLRGPENDYQYAIVWTLAVLSTIVFSVLTWLKLRFARLLECESLRKDGICSLIGTVLSGVIIGTTVLADWFNNILWWIDPFVAFLAGMMALFLGVQALYIAMVVQGKAIGSVAWWKQESSTSTTVVDETAQQAEDVHVEVVDLPNGGGGSGQDKEIV